MFRVFTMYGDIWHRSLSEDDDTASFLASDRFQARAMSLESGAVFAGIFTLVASSMVVGTVIMFPSMWHNKVYMQMIILVSVCQLFTAIAVLMGFPITWECSTQGFLLFFFYRCGWMWNCLTVWQLHHIIAHSKIQFTLNQMHLIVWPINIALSLLPLTTGDWYGAASVWEGNDFCSLSVTGKNFFLWVATLFFGPLQLSMLFLFFMCTKIIYKLRKAFASADKNASAKLVKGVLIYPVMMLCTWLPLLIFFFSKFGDTPAVDKNEHDRFLISYTYLGAFYIWTTLEGFLTALAFFWNSREARRRWKGLFRQLFNNKEENNNIENNMVKFDNDDGSSVGTQPLIVDSEGDFLSDKELEDSIRMQATNSSAESEHDVNSQNKETRSSIIEMS